MIDKSVIEEFLALGALDRALEALDKNIEEDSGCAEWWYMRGRTYWRKDRRGKAISDYEEAVHLDSNSPAVHALEYARSIMDFYNPDLLNP